MRDIIIINMDRYSLERDAVLLLAKKLHLRKEEIDASMYNLWVDEKHTRLSHLEARQQLEDWFNRPGQNIVWKDVTIAITIARRDIDVFALRAARAWLALKSNRVSPLYWLPREVCDQAYREDVESNTHPGFVALEADVSICGNVQREFHCVLRNYHETMQAYAEESREKLEDRGSNQENEAAAGFAAHALGKVLGYSETYISNLLNLLEFGHEPDLYTQLVDWFNDPNPGPFESLCIPEHFNTL